MPCENCSTQFTVFKRKKTCNECRRLYCSNCLQKKKELALCERCVIFTARPLSKNDLQKLKPKDLIFYLQSKHISTAGCVEKEELVNLVLAHGRTSTPTSTTNSHRGSTTTTSNNIFDDNCANPFASIRQTCTTFFNSISDKIAADLHKVNAAAAAYETAKAAGSSSQNRPTPQQQQPSRSTNNNVYHSTENSSRSSFASVNVKVPGSEPSTPTSPNAASSSSTASSSRKPAAVHRSRPKSNIPGAKLKHLLASEDNCECCSDDERPAEVVEQQQQQQPGTSRATTEGGPVKSDSSTASSFEELGVSSSAATATTAPTNDSTDSWQIINQTNSSNFSLDNPPSTSVQSNNNNETLNVSSRPAKEPLNLKNSFKNISRRRSDSSVVLKTGSRANLNDSEDDDEVDDAELTEEVRNRKRRKSVEGDSARKRCCDKCGKRKNGISRSVARFRRQLEQSDLSEEEKQRKLDEFLKYLEDRTRNSLDFSDSEDGEAAGCDSVDVSSQAAGGDDGGVNNVMVEEEDDIIMSLEDENQGIHVYATGEEQPKPVRRFIQLDDIKTSSELDALTVKQLKEILVLNRVDFKGCCEKNELLERVQRLWNDHACVPSIEKLLPDDICKICMDAPIECILLECGHMACCTNCGKVLSECPICRQYIVRVVRFFRA